MEGVLEATIFLCVCKLTCSLLLCVPAVAHAVTAVTLCSICLLVFTDLAITLFLVFVWITESWLEPFQLSSDVIALRFLLFLCQMYGVVLLLTPPLIAVELLVNLLSSQENKERAEDTDVRCQGESLSRTVGFLSCLHIWIVSGIYSSNSWMLGQLSAESCLENRSYLLNCLPGFFMTPSPGIEELSWCLPAMVLLLSFTGGMGLFKTGRVKRKGLVALSLTHIQQPKLHKAADQYMSQSPGEDSKKTSDSCAVYRAGFVYNDKRCFCRENVALCSYQTGLPFSFVQQQKLSTSCAPFLQSETELLQEMTLLEANKMEHCDCVKTEPLLKEVLEPQRKQERESPCLGKEIFRGLVCAALVCVFPTVVSGNVLLILNLETLVVLTVKVLSLSDHAVPVVKVKLKNVTLNV